jgi:hypothetical protein
MVPDRLMKTMATGKFEMRATQESLAIKEKNREAREAKATDD